MTTEFAEIQRQLSDVFGTYRAEWLQDQVFDLFTEPRYFPELTTRQSCVLIGGRGTGKTTVLRGLSYEGQQRLSERRKGESFDSEPFIGVYHRINTNHIAAFHGGQLSEEGWTRLFAHYFNLLLCQLLFEFLVWHENQTGERVEFAPRQLQRVCKSLHLEPKDDFREIHEDLIDAILEFESLINNVDDDQSTPLSMQQRPVELLCDAILSLPIFKGRHFFFLLDEYENLLIYQQKVVNTFIKHTSGKYFFKIGVKELGWSCRTTLQPNEQLISPADYALVSIGDRMKDEAFLSFAIDVCETRLSRVVIHGQPIEIDLRESLPGLDIDSEASLLGIDAIATQITKEYKTHLSSPHFASFANMPPLEKFFLKEWADSHDQSPSDVIVEKLDSPKKWAERYENYKYASLFAIRRKKRGIDKYYCGLDVYSQLACGNIRYMLELVDHSFMTHVREGKNPVERISYVDQTKAAQHVGSMNLAELEGLSVSGAKLTKLLLSMGRVFQQLAASPFGHAPEVNQFHLANASKDVEELMRNAVMHLALVRIAGTKLGGASDTIEFDYTIHPVFAPLFEFSPRRKRKMDVTAEDIVDLIENPKQGISNILKRHNRLDAGDIPRQLALFAQFYDGDE